MNWVFVKILELNIWIFDMFAIPPYHLGDPILPQIGIALAANLTCVAIDVAIVLSPVVILLAVCKVVVGRRTRRVSPAHPGCNRELDDFKA